MIPKNESLQPAELHFEGDSLEVLSAFPSAVKHLLGSHSASFNSAESRHARRAA